jgi:flagellar P-ring protein precursor FlgI
MTTRIARTLWFASWNAWLSSSSGYGDWPNLTRIGVVALLVFAPLLPSAADTTARRVRIKDVATIEGVRDNQLIGYGIVVGLNGTGDSQQTLFPVQTLISTLQRMGVNVPTTGSANSLRVQNMAAVFIAATLPPFAESGTKLDITVSSAGDARSLNGGLLLMTPLYGPDGRIYAQAQGPIVLGGYAAAANGNAKVVNHPTTGRVPGGAMVERGVPLDLSRLPALSILLNDADFRTAERMADAINSELKRPLAHAADSRRVDLHPQPGEDLPALLARVEAVEIDTFPRAKVVVNERTGTVVIGGNVRLLPVSILHGGLVVNVVSDVVVSQPGPFSNGTTQTVQETRVNAQDKPVNQIVLKSGATVDDLVEELQGIGASARDVISILQAMKEAGALEAELEVL